jgi:hypothetical protein
VAAGYALTVTLVFGYVRHHREVYGVQWIDLALPWRWSNYRVARGEHYLAQAQRMITSGKFRDAMIHARAGLALSPANRNGRLLLADLLQAARRPEFARETLLGGLEHHHDDADYVRTVMMFLLRQQEDNVIASLADRFLSIVPPGSDAARVFALAAATGSHLRGHYDQAEDQLRLAPRLAESREGRLLGAKIEWDRGYRELSLVQLRQLMQERPDDLEIHEYLVSRLRAAGYLDEARRESLAFQIAHPALPGPRIELLEAYSEAGDAPRMAEEVEALLRDFPEDRNALVSLADFAANSGHIELADRLVAHAKRRTMAADTFALLAIEARIVAGEFRAALDAVQRFKAENSEADARYRSLLVSLQGTASIGVGDQPAARVFFAELTGSSELRADNLLALANRCAALGAGDVARQLLSRALEIDAKNQAALTRLTQLDWEFSEISALAGHLQQLLATRRPSPDLLRVAQLKLGSDLLLFAPDAQATLATLETLLSPAHR